MVIYYLGDRMRKLKYLLLLLLVVPMIAKADVNTVIGDSVNEDNKANSSSAIFGNNITSNNITEGIEALFGNNVNYNGTSDYSLVFGNNININGIINNDGFIFGNLVNINEDSEVNRDLIIFGSEVKINGKINRDVRIFASSVVINGEVTGNLSINATNIDINEAVIGILSYNKDATVNIADNAKIGETILTDEILTKTTLIDQVIKFIINLISTLVLFSVICLIIPQLFKRVNDKNKSINVLSFFSLFGFGALSLILIPAISLVLFSFTFTFSLALLSLVLYIIAICLATIFTGYLLGYIIWKNFVKKEENPLLIGLVGITIISILTSIPTLGFIFSFLAIMIGMGIILQQFRKD